MFASLPMYDLPELRAETDALWGAIRGGLARRGVEAPRELSRPADLPGDWLRPDLLLSQTCGLPFVRALRGRVAVVGALEYDVPDCPPGTYRSRLVVRKDDEAQGIADLAGRVAAVNSADSQSGSGALRAAVTPLRAPGGAFFGRVIETGAHLASIRAVARGEADVAAIDAVTFALASRHLPEAQALRVLGSTAPTPGLPLLTHAGGPARALFEAVEEAIEAVGPAVRDALLLRGILPRAEADFDAIAEADRTTPALP